MSRLHPLHRTSHDRPCLNCGRRASPNSTLCPICENRLALAEVDMPLLGIFMVIAFVAALVWLFSWV